MDNSPQWAGQLLERLGKVESLLADLIRQGAAKEWYTTAEVAKLLGKEEYTVRQWCNLGRVNARKKGRRKFAPWAISHEELLRYQREGLLPLERISTVIDKDNLF